MQVEITATGHSNILANHHSTFQLTTETELTPRGDCIIAVGASMAAKDLPEEIKGHLRSGGWLTIRVEVAGMSVEARGQGHPDMDLDHPHDMVFRRSDYVCGRTVTVGTDLTADNLPREMVRLLQQQKQQVTITLRAE